MKTPSLSRFVTRLVSLACCGVAAISLRADQNLAGNVTVTGGVSTGNLSVTGAIDSDGNVTFGTQGGTYGAALLYVDAAIDTFTFSINRNPASWLWQHNSTITAMRLNSAHDLVLYQSDGTTAGVTLQPSSNSLKLGSTATLTGDGGGVLTSSGDLTVGGALASTGSLTAPTAAFASGLNNTPVGNSSPGTGAFTSLSASGLVSFTNTTAATDFSTAAVVLSGGLAVAKKGFFGDRVVIKESGTTTIPADTGDMLRLHNQGFGGSIMGEGAGAAFGARIQGRLSSGTFASPAATPAGSVLLRMSGSGYGTAYSNNKALLDLMSLNTWSASDNSTQLRLQLTPSGGTTPATVGTWDSTGLAVTGSLLLNSGNGAYNHYRNVAAAYLGGSTQIGTLKITLPKYRSSTMLNVTIRGYDYSSYGAWSVTIGGYNYSGDQTWYNLSATIEGRAPFKTVRLANNGTNDLILLGDVNTAWQYGHVEVTDVIAGYANITGWGTNWSIVLITNEAGISAISTPVVDMFRDSGGKIGIGTTSPQSKVHIADLSASGANQEMLSLQTAYSTNGSQKALTWRDGSQITGQIDTRYDGTSVNMVFGHLYNAGYQTGDVMTVKGTGNVGIGTANPTHKLAVAGTIRAYEVIVDTGWADYVFEDDYHLAPLSEVEQHIKESKHLPGIPSAAEVAAHGVSMGEMQSKLLSKVEELTLHLIRMEKENAALRDRVQALETVAK